MAEFVFVFCSKWAEGVLWLVGVMVVAEADVWLLVICELWWFSTEVLVALVGGRFGWFRVEEGRLVSAHRCTLEFVVQVAGGL